MLIKYKKYLQYDIFEYDIVDSTMNKIKTFKENTIIIAQTQTNGKGKGNRIWISNNNENLYFSLKINADKNRIYSQCSYIVGLSIINAIKSCDNKNNKILLKWPNDILINNKKVCGILLEKDLQTLIIGTGVNIYEFPENVFFPSTSLKNENIKTEKYELLEKILENFNILYNDWLQNGFESIKEKLLTYLYKLNQEIKINNLFGILKGFDTNGNLILQMPNKTINICSGDIFNIN